MEHEYNYEQIEAFLDGELEGNELTQFKQELEADARLAQELEWVKAMRLGVVRHQQRDEGMQLLALTQLELEEEGVFQEFMDIQIGEEVLAKGVGRAVRNDYRNQLDSIHTELEQNGELVKETPKTTEKGQIRQLPFRRYWAAAAMIILLVAAGLFYLPKGDTDVFASNFEPYEDKISEDVEIVLSERGAAFDVAAIEALQQGLVDYQNKEYAKAITIFEKYLKSSTKDYKGVEVQFYLAVSYLAEGQAQKAIEQFDMLDGHPKFKWTEDADWYLALAYIKNGQNSEAQKVLEGLKMSSIYGTKVQGVLEKMK